MIIGITGSDGAGKGTVVEYLTEAHGYAHYSSRSFILEHIARAGLEPTRNQMRLTANELRKTYGNDFVVRQAYEAAERDGVSRAVIESIRALAEAEYLKERGGILLAVDADQALRYGRVQARRSESDQVSFAEFQEHEALERNDPDPNGMQKAAVMARADHTIFNDGSFDELTAAVDDFLARFANGA